MKFVPTTKSNVNNYYLVQSEITSLCLCKEEFNINIYTTVNNHQSSSSNNNLCISRKAISLRESQQFFRKNKKSQVESLRRKSKIIKNWKNQNFCIATS